MSSKSLAPMKGLASGGGPLGPIYPQSFEDVQRLAKMAVAAGLSQRTSDDTEESAIAKATAAILQGLECDVPPMQAVQNIAIIKGRALIWGDLLLAILWSKGFKVKQWWEGLGQTRIAHCRITRPDGEVIERQFSVADAVTAKLWDTRGTLRKKGRNGEWYDAPNDSAWHRFPDDMLGWKAAGRAVRSGASDATRGMMIRQDYEDALIDVTPSASATPSAVTAPSTAVLDLPDIPDEPSSQEPASDPVAECREAIKSAVSVEMLDHLFEIYADADISSLEDEFAAKRTELEAAARQ